MSSRGLRPKWIVLHSCDPDSPACPGLSYCSGVIIIPCVAIVRRSIDETGKTITIIFDRRNTFFFKFWGAEHVQTTTFCRMASMCSNKVLCILLCMYSVNSFPCRYFVRMWIYSGRHVRQSLIKSVVFEKKNHGNQVR